MSLLYSARSRVLAVHLGSLACTLVCAPPTALAHDFWLLPSEMKPSPNAQVEFSLFIGHIENPEAFPRDPSHIEKFELRSPAGTVAIGGAPGRQPAGVAAFPAAPIALAVYKSSPRLAILQPAAFGKYVREESLEAAITKAGRSANPLQPQRDLYTRCAMAMLRTPALSQPDYPTQASGCRLDLQLLSAPWKDSADTTLRFRVVMDGDPLEGILVRARLLPEGSSFAEGRTDSRGEVQLPANRAGIWLVSAVHLQPFAQEETQSKSRAKIDWESFWTSLVFEREIR